MRSMVEGACRKRDDRSENAIDVSCHVTCPHPQHAEAVLPYELITHLIRRGAVPIVHSTIHFDYEACVDAAEIDHVRPERMLFPETQAKLMTAKTLP